MEFFERMNKEKLVFFGALLLFGVTGWRVTTKFLEYRVPPANPTVPSPDLKQADPRVLAEVQPQPFSLFDRFGTRNPLQPPSAAVAAMGVFTITEMSGMLMVSGAFDCKPDGRVDRVMLRFPQRWSLQAGGGELQVVKQHVSGASKEIEMALKTIQQANFKLPLTLLCQTRESSVEFPEIVLKNATQESGFVAVQDSPGCEFTVKETSGLKQAESVPPELRKGKAKAVYQYSSHPYKLALNLQRKVVAIVAPPKPPKPPKPPDMVKPPDVVKPPDDDQPPVAKGPEIPFSFKGMVRLTKPTVLLEDKQSGKLTRYGVGDKVNGLEIVNIYSTSITVKDAEGTEYELQDALRQKYD